MFKINGIYWEIVFVKPNSPKLHRSNGTVTVGMTDWNDKCVYMNCNLKGNFFRKVLAHELCHCFCFSYNVVMPLEEEEFLADWISLYGTELIYLLDDLMSSFLSRVV